MRVIVKKWGNSASIRIPATVLKAARIELNDPVDVREEQGRIVVEPLRPSSYDLADLLDRITPDNLHEEVDFGRPVGRERLDTCGSSTSAL
jgi:antitoxin MazE